MIQFSITAFQQVQMGSKEHLLPLILTLIFGIFLILYSNKNLSEKSQHLVFMLLGFIVSGFVITNQILKIMEGYDIHEDLPLFLCGLMGLIIPVFTITRKYWMFEILSFWILTGTMQSIITPDIADGFPKFNFIRYWVLHLGLILIVFYAFYVFKMRPTFKSIFKSFGALQIYVVSMFIVNYLLGANYFYLNNKPDAATLLDLLGDWPIYLLVTELIILPYFFLIYGFFNFKWKPILQKVGLHP